MKRLLIANRGEIAVRIATTARRMGLEIVAVYSDADADAPHVRTADFAERLGGAAPSESYLDIDAVLRAAAATGADAVHPGYGFLAESAEFAERCVATGLTFVGPSAAAMRALGNKAESKRLLAGTGVPFLPGYHGEDQRDDVLAAEAAELGFPLMIKASAGGGGRGMRLVTDGARFLEALRAARSEAMTAFGDDDVLLERAVLRPRHVEVQIFGDAFGNVVHLGERDCSVQRRHQKIIEEAPSPAVDAALRERLGATAIAVARAASYVGAGTVEFLLDEDGAYFFIEMNTRLQVEHPVTEAITNQDLVEWQLRVASGEPLPLAQDAISFHGHAIEARLCAEDPAHDFLPQAGTLVAWAPPPGVRVDAALASGITITPSYDSMIAKLIGFGTTREEARTHLVRGLETCVALGITTNRSALIAYLEDPRFVAGDVTTRFIEERAPLEPGADAIPATVPALAASVLYALAADDGDFGPWTAWSSSRLPGSTFTLAFDGGAPRTIAVVARSSTDVTAVVDGEPVRVAIAEIAPWGRTVRYRANDDPQTSLTFARDGERTYLTIGGRTYAVTDFGATVSASTASAGAGDGFLRAPMSGRIVSVHAVAGETVKSGVTLVVLEAMKMEHVLTLPIDAVIGEITARGGVQVHASDILLAYEPAAPS